MPLIPSCNGDITGDPAYKAHMMRLQVEERYAVNSKGESVPIKEVAWGTKGRCAYSFVVNLPLIMVVLI